MKPFNQGRSSLDKILWVVILIGMVANALGGKFSLGAFFLMPTPLIVLNVLVSPINAGVMIIGTTVLFIVEKGFLGGTAFFLLIGLFSQLQGLMIRRTAPVSRTLFWGVIFILGSSLSLTALGMFDEARAGATLLSSVANNLKSAIQASAYGDKFTAEDLAGFFPFFLLYLIVIFAASNFFLSRWILKNRGVSVISLGTLSDFQLPQRILEGFVFLFLMGYAMEFTGWNGGRVLVDTLFYLAAFVFMFQGLGVCAYYMKRYEVPLPWQAVILVGLLVLSGPIGLGLAGISDVLMDFRKQRRTGGDRG